jgi:hypothetical protein
MQMHANVVLARECKQEWCAKVCRFIKSIGYMESLGEEARVIEEFDVSRPSDLSKAVQRFDGLDSSEEEKRAGGGN